MANVWYVPSAEAWKAEICVRQWAERDESDGNSISHQSSPFIHLFIYFQVLCGTGVRDGNGKSCRHEAPGRAQRPCIVDTKCIIQRFSGGAFCSSWFAFGGSEKLVNHGRLCTVLLHGSESTLWLWMRSAHAAQRQLWIYGFDKLLPIYFITWICKIARDARCYRRCSLHIGLCARCNKSNVCIQLTILNAFGNLCVDLISTSIPFSSLFFLLFLFGFTRRIFVALECGPFPFWIACK